MRLAFVLGFLLIAGCASFGTCALGEQRAISELVYFGTDRAGGRVTESEWSEFLRGAVTPRFPAGFTTWAATGQWSDAGGRIVQEPSFVLNVIHPADAASDLALRELAAEYKSKFRQEAVLRVRSPACTSF